MEIDINIPTSLSEITLRQFQQFSKKVTDETKESELHRIILSTFCGVDLKDTLKVKAVDAKAITDIVLAMLNEEPQRVAFFKMNGKEFAFHPNLDDMSLGEYVDLDKNITDYETMQYAMAVLYRPVTNIEKGLYNIEEYTPNKYDMLDMPMSAVLYANVFFYNLGNDLLKTMSHSFSEQEVELLGKMGLVKNGDGMVQFTHSLTGILQDLNISLN